MSNRKNQEQPIVALANKTEEQISYNNLLLSNKEVLASFIKENGIKGWPTTNWTNGRKTLYLKFYQGNVISEQIIDN